MIDDAVIGSCYFRYFAFACRRYVERQTFESGSLWLCAAPFPSQGCKDLQATNLRFSVRAYRYKHADILPYVPPEGEAEEGYLFETHPRATEA
jgi:hypothetical protein